MEKRISDALRLSIKHFKQQILTKLLRTTTRIQRFLLFFFLFFFTIKPVSINQITSHL